MLTPKQKAFLKILEPSPITKIEEELFVTSLSFEIKVSNSCSDK